MKPRTNRYFFQINGVPANMPTAHFSAVVKQTLSTTVALAYVITALSSPCYKLSVPFLLTLTLA